MIDMKEVQSKFMAFTNNHLPGTGLSESYSNTDRLQESVVGDPEACDLSSTTSYVAANGNVFMHSLEDVDNLIDLDPSPIGDYK